MDVPTASEKTTTQVQAKRPNGPVTADLIRVSHVNVNERTGEVRDIGPAYFAMVAGASSGIISTTPLIPYPSEPDAYAPPPDDTLRQLLTEQARTNALLERLLAQRTHTLHGTERDDDYSARTEHARQRDEATRKTLAAAHQKAL